MEKLKKEKMIKIRLGKLGILTMLVSIAVVLNIINLYWTANLANQLASLTNGVAGELREVQPQQPTQQQEQPLLRVEVSVDDDPSIGPINAPITIVEFSDFRCPFSTRVRPTITQILEAYSDRVRFVFRDFPILGPQSEKTAEASECADEQGKFWEYRDKLFESQQVLDTSILKQYARELGLNTRKFDDCLDAGKMAEEVEKDIRDGQSYGVSGTPAFFINGILVSGAQPYSVFEQIIEQELNKL